MHVVKDDQRELEFDGQLLSKSSSYRSGSPRWVEFELYRTASGSYVLSRTGWSTTYHKSGCAVIQRNRLKLQTRDSLLTDATACEQCRPDAYDDMVAPEQPRHWAQVSDTPNGVVNSLYKFDQDGTRYLTNVAKRLLADAARIDSDLRTAFFREQVA